MSRTERPRKTKIGTEPTSHDSDIIFKVKRSKVKVTGAVAYCGGLPHSLLVSLVKLLSCMIQDLFTVRIFFEQMNE